MPIDDSAFLIGGLVGGLDGGNHLARFAGGSLYRQYGSSGEDGVSLLAEYDDRLNLRNIYTAPPGRLVGADADTLFFLGEETVDETGLLRYQPGRRP